MICVGVVDLFFSHFTCVMILIKPVYPCMRIIVYMLSWADGNIQSFSEANRIYYISQNSKT